MTAVASDHPQRRRVLLVLNLALRLAIVYWLAEAWILRDDPRFAGKAIPERNTVIIGTVSLLIPAIWWFRSLPWSTYPLGLDIAYLSIFAIDMAGNSFDLYESYTYFDLIPHFHSPGVVSLLVATYWTRTRHPEAPDLPDRRWLIESTLVGAGVATMIHVVIEAQEYYTDVLAGTRNVGGVSDVVNDLVVGLAGALVYPPLAIRWFLPGKVRIGWRSVVTVIVLLVFAAVALWSPGPRFTDFVADQFATAPPDAPLSAEARSALLEAAQAGAADRGLPASGEVRHAHDSVTVDELMEALTGGYQSIEGDVGLAGETPVMRHDPRDPAGMTFLEWLEVVAAADFGIVKLDVKRDKVGPFIEDIRTAIEEFGLREESLLINFDVLEGPGAYGELDWQERIYSRLVLKQEPEDLLELARAFPSAAFSVGSWVGPVAVGEGYTTTDIEATMAVAEDLRDAGVSRVVVAARWDLLTDEFVEAMATADVTVDVWNSLTIVSPDDPAAETARLRARYGGAIGTIDLRN